MFRSCLEICKYFISKLKKKKKNRKQFKNIPHRVYNYRKIGAYIEKEKEKRKQFSNRNNNPSSTKLPIFQKIPKREKYTHTHTETRLLSIKTTGKVFLPPEEERSEQEEKDRGARLSGAMGKKSGSGKGSTVAD